MFNIKLEKIMHSNKNFFIFCFIIFNFKWVENNRKDAAALNAQLLFLCKNQKSIFILQLKK